MELKFNSQVCTTKEQSQRLLELGLKPETADMYYLWLGGNDYRLKVDIGNNPLKYNMDKTYIPAWSLHRLMELTSANIMEGNVIILNYDNTYDDIIENIEWAINKGFFYKEYLNNE